jgi:predicted nucleic acid-binding protein
VITLDTSGVVALLSRRDPDHAAAKRVLERGSVTTVVPAPILAEVAYMLDVRSGPSGTRSFLTGLIQGETLVDCADRDLPRIVELIDRYADLELGFADAAVIACAERNGGDLLTFDRRDLEVVAREVPIALLP